MEASYVDHMGTDINIVNAARVSLSNESELLKIFFDQQSDAIKYAEREQGIVVSENHEHFLQWFVQSLNDGDKQLISFLARNNHWTPFAHTAITLRMKAPVPIRTQCFKHKQGFVENEESRRYIKTKPTFFIPQYFRKSSKSIKQGSIDEVHANSDEWKKKYSKYVRKGIKLYLRMIDDGVPAEQARFILPQGVEVQWVWTGSLAAFARFYRQRTDPHAQKEIRDLAEVVGDIVKPLFPVCWDALTGGCDEANH